MSKREINSRGPMSKREIAVLLLGSFALMYVLGWGIAETIWR